MEIDDENTAASESQPNEISNSEVESESLHDKTEQDYVSSSTGINPAPGASVQFKKPLLIGPRKGVHKFSKIKTVAPDSEAQSEEAKPPEEKTSKLLQQSRKLDKSPAEKIVENSTPVPYKEPKWSGLPSSPYSFEVLKSGTIVETIDLSNKSFFVFGRLGNCDIVMAHPTVSRFHAVLQYGSGEKEDAPGFYLYDLGSTHGTYLNKARLKPNMFVRVQVGHMIKLGMSTRNFILQGPPEDEEAESELSVTELKTKALREKLNAEAAETQRRMLEELEEERRRKKEEEDGIDWGMGEDADEETDLSENPFAVAPNEELYINDPKKTLRGWFEREGYELVYDCQEKSFGQFVCRVELPIDNSKGIPLVAEAIVRGKKKESVVQCALEACRILDQYGLLRQSNHESKKRKAKNWEDNDFYDSDEDTFLDRTGTVEKKRKLRMKNAGIKTNSEVHTYKSLTERHDEILREIQEVELQLKESPKEKEEEKVDESIDELDAYMSSLSKDDKKGKKNIQKLKAHLASLKQEEVNVRNLANIAKPAELPELKPSLLQSTSNVKKVNKMPIFGKRKITRKPLTVFQKSENEKMDCEGDDQEEVDSE